MQSKHFYRVIPVLLIFIIFCGIKQPTITDTGSQATGAIFVTSSPAGASIFLDNLPTLLSTPDTLKNVPAGQHVVKVFKNGFFARPESLVVTVNKDETVLAGFTLEEIVNQARLVVESIPDGAEIWLDGAPSGKFTPDTVIVQAGQRQVSLRKNGYKNYVFASLELVANTTVHLNKVYLQVQPQILIEAFGNTSCLPCTTTAIHLENFARLNPSEDYALVEYFSNWPNSQDIFYLANPAANMARIMAYRVTTVPAVFLAGTGTDPLDCARINSDFATLLKNANTEIGLSLTRQVSDSIRVRVEMNGLNIAPADDWRLFLALVENDIHFNSPPGTNGLKDFNHVFRTFLTANTGDPIASGTGTVIKNYAIAISSGWNVNQIEIIGFIQDWRTKRVIQASHL